VSPVASLREWIEWLRGRGELELVSRPVSRRFEIAALAHRFDGRKAVLCPRVEGHAMPVVANCATRRDLYAAAAGVEPTELLDRFAAAIDAPRPCRIVEQARVQEVVIREAIDIGTLLPVPLHHERDAGAYITAGVVIARDPETGRRNASIHRLQVLERETLGILILPRHLWHLYLEREARSAPLEVAVAIGLDPLTLLASQAITPPGVDELEIASALRGSPLPLARCVSVDLEVPAEAEIVLEGVIPPHLRRVEGPFGEFPRYYGPPSEKPVLQVRAVTHRRDAIYQTILPAGREHLLLGGIAREASLLRALRASVPAVAGVHLTPGGACRYHAVVALRKRHEGDARTVLFATFATIPEVKHVIVVDEDVDIYDPEEVEWAVATRCQADRDVLIVPRAKGSELDPSSADGLGAKMGIDATIPLDAPAERFLRIRIPLEEFQP